MRINGKDYYLNRDESLALAMNDVYPNKEALQRRNNFFQEIDRTLFNVHTDQNGGIFAQVDGLDEAIILEALKRKDFPVPQYVNEHYMLKTATSLHSSEIEQNIKYRSNKSIPAQRKDEISGNWCGTSRGADDLSFVAA